MRVTRTLALLLICACASNNRSYSRENSGKTPSAPSRADTLRARSLADATTNPGGRAAVVDGSAKMHFPIEALQAEEEAAVIVAFVVLPNGRVDRESRTIIYLDGHPIFAQAVCDFLLEARVKLEHPSDKPAYASYASVFRIRNLPKPPEVGGRIDEMMRRLNGQLFTKLRPERAEWLIARPGCSALKKRDM